MRKKVDLQQGDIFTVLSDACWSYDFDGDRILINERWPLEELHSGTIVVGLEERTLPYSQVFGVDPRQHIRVDSVQLVKVISPSGKIGWIMSRHLRHL